MAGGVSATVATSANAMGQAFSSSSTLTGNRGVKIDPTAGCVLPQAASLNETTTSSGTVTTTAAPSGITTSSLVDVYWNGGFRAGMTVSSVTGSAIAVTGGTGTNFPSGSATACCIVPQVIESETLTGNNIQFIGMTPDTTNTVVVTFYNGSTVLVALEVAPNESYIWGAGLGVTNPLAGDTITSVGMSQDGGFLANSAISGATIYPSTTVVTN